MTKTRTTLLLAAALFVCGLLTSESSFGKKGNGGGGNGGGDEPPTLNYSLVLLGTLGGDYSIAEGMNENGDVVGWSETGAGDQHAFLSTSGNGTMIDLNDELDPADRARWILKQALDINDSGQIVGVGYWLDASGNYVGRRAYRFTPGTPPTIENLGTLGGNSSSAKGINNHGEVVGTSLALDPNSSEEAYLTRAFLYADVGNGEEMIDLGLIVGANATNGASINNNAETAGFSTFGDGFIYRAWRSDGIMQNLGVITKNRGNIEESSAAHISDNGEVVGWSTAGGRKYHAFLYTNGGMQDLGTLGGDDSAATGINQEGDVVGWAETGDGIRHIFLHSPQEGMARVEIVGGLPGVLYHNTQCKINNSGEISGTLTDTNGNQKAFFLKLAL